MTAVARARPRLALLEPLGRWWDRQHAAVRWAIVAAALLGALLLPHLSPLDRKWESIFFYPVLVFIVLALGLNIVVGQAGLLDLGYVAFFAVGAYTTAKLTVTFGWGTWEALVASVAMAMVSGVVLGAPTLRLRGDYLAIVTLGFGEIVRIVAQNSESLGEARGITGIPHPSGVFGAEFGSQPLPYYYLALAGIVVAIAVIRRLTRSRVGRAWAAVREDEDAAEAMGVPTFKMKLWAFAVGASTGGLAGWIYASRVSFISPDNFRFELSILFIAAVVLGGMGSVPGAIAGAFAIAFIPEYLRNVPFGDTVVDWLNTATGGEVSNIQEYRVLIFGLALVIMMIFRPQGLLPSRQRAAELAEATGAGGLAATADAAHVVEVEAEPDAMATTAVPGEAEVAEVAELLEAVEEERGIADVTTVLTLSGVTMDFGGVRALDDVSLEVRRGEIFGIIGPNGAGKTTVFNCVTGVFRPTTGSIRLADSELVGLVPHRITEKGICRTFQNIRLFPNMSALQNVVVGTDARHRTSVPGALLGLPTHRREERHGHDEAVRLLEFVGIGHRRDEAARNLPYGDQRRLEIARAMATVPTVLLLDEPAAGMNPSEKRALIGLIREIRATGLTIVLIEHDMGLVMNVCDRIAVLDFGEKIAEGVPADIQNDRRVIEAYLGTTEDAS